MQIFAVYFLKLPSTWLQKKLHEKQKNRIRMTLFKADDGGSPCDAKTFRFSPPLPVAKTQTAFFCVPIFCHTPHPPFIISYRGVL